VETVYLDTHVVVWLFSGETEKLSKKAVDLIEENELFISAMVELELEFLYEIGRLNYNSKQIVKSLSDSIDLKVCPISFYDITKVATKLGWTRDPFDRLIVSNAICNDSYLLTKDKKILDNFKNAIW